MEKTIQESLEQIQKSLDALIRQVSALNEGLRKNKLAELNTEILDSNEAAAYLKVTTRYLQALRSKGELRFFQIDSLIRYKKADLDKWLNSYQLGK